MTRGAASSGTGRPNSSGTIPARAGSSTWPRTATNPRWDHSRTRGEQPAPLNAAEIEEGPSPRVQGAGQKSEAASHVLGTIPAGAGSSDASRCRWRRTGAIPTYVGSRSAVAAVWPDGGVGAGRRNSAQELPNRGDHTAGAGAAGEPNHAGLVLTCMGAVGPSPERGLLLGTIPAGAGSRRAAGRT